MYKLKIISNWRKNTFFCNVWLTYPKNIFLFKLSERNTRKRCEIYSKLKIKPSKPCPSGFLLISGRIKVRISDALIFNFEHISYNVLVCKLTSIEIVSAFILNFGHI